MGSKRYRKRRRGGIRFQFECADCRTVLTPNNSDPFKRRCSACIAKRRAAAERLERRYLGF